MAAVCCSSCSLFPLAVLFQLAVAPRVASLENVETDAKLIKLHLSDPKHSTNKWASSDLEHVVNNYHMFLEGGALTGCMINETILAKRMSQQCQSSWQDCEELAEKMAHALSWCRANASLVDTALARRHMHQCSA